MSTSQEPSGLFAEEKPPLPERLAAEFVDQAQLAARLSVHPRTVRRMVDRGELPRPCVGAGGRPRWLWSCVLEHCRKQHHQAARLDDKLKSKLRP